MLKGRWLGAEWSAQLSWSTVRSTGLRRKACHMASRSSAHFGHPIGDMTTSLNCCPNAPSPSFLCHHCHQPHHVAPCWPGHWQRGRQGCSGRLLGSRWGPGPCCWRLFGKKAHLRAGHVQQLCHRDLRSITDTYSWLVMQPGVSLLPVSIRTSRSAGLHPCHCTNVSAANPVALSCR